MLSQSTVVCRVLVPVLGLLLVSGTVWFALASSARDRPSPRVLLVTAFGPFGDIETNPSWEAARVLEGQVLGGRTTVRTARFDVVYETAAAQLEAALEGTAPDLVLSLGVAPGDHLRIEVVARNRDASAAPDNADEVREGRAIREDGPALLPSRLPVGRILEALREAGYEARTSEDAGGYLCNHVFYRLVDRFDEAHAAGFVHVPVLDGETWDLERLRAAVRLVVEVLCAE